MTNENHTNVEQISEFNRSIQKITKDYLSQFPDEVERLSNLNSLLQNPNIDLGVRTTIPQGHICASGIITSPDYQSVLMLHHKSLGIWVVPGGHFDKEDITPENTALREAFEETGYLNLAVNEWHSQKKIPLDIDTHAIPANPKKNEGAHLHYDFRYVLRAKNEQDVNIDPNESLGFKWVKADEVDPRTSVAPAIAKLRLLRDL